jgi:intracellular sulfur oxidation DsrE/DsrF family protein
MAFYYFIIVIPMKSYLKYSLAIPVFAAVFLVAMSAFPAQQQVDAYTRTVMVHITSDDNHRAMMGIEHATAMLASGKNVAVLLDVNGVKVGASNPSATLKATNEELQQFLASGGRVIACEHCISMAGLQNTDMLPGVEIDSHPNMPKMQRLIDEGATILDY